MDQENLKSGELKTSKKFQSINQVMDNFIKEILISFFTLIKMQEEKKITLFTSGKVWIQVKMKKLLLLVIFSFLFFFFFFFLAFFSFLFLFQKKYLFVFLFYLALATALDDEYGGAPVQVRVVQNKEPEHFLNLFKGKFIIHRGGKASGFKNSDQKDEESAGTRLYHVKGTSSSNTKACQVDLAASSLNSNDCFVLVTPKMSFSWLGKFSTGDEREVAKSVADSLSPPGKVEAVYEGGEKADFWEAIGGKGDYHNKKAEAIPEFEPRLFQCSNASGNFDVEEIFDFTQEDLIADDIMLLDAWSEVFLWIGSGANDIEKKESLKMAIDYVKNSPGDRSPETTPILTVKQGFEPPLFTCHFIWDAEKAKAGVSNYDELKAALQASSESGSGGSVGVSNAAKELAKYSKTYSYEILLKRPLPEGVDATSLEVRF